MWPLWRNAAGSLARIINVPSDAELWVDGRHIPFLREDSKDIAEIKVSQSLAIKQLTEAGFEPDSVVEAITTDDLTRLKHTGMTSVQLLPPGTPKTPDTPAPAPAKDGTNSDRSDQLMLDVLRESRRELVVHNHIPEQRASNVTVEPAEVSVTLEQPAPAEVTVNVEAQEAPKVEFGERAIVVEAAPAPDVNVTVEAAEAPKVEFGERSFVVEPAEVSVTVQAPDAPPPAEVTVNVDAPPAPPPAEVNIEFNPELRASLEIDEAVADALRQAPEVTVNVEPTPVTIENTVQVDPTPVQVNIADEPSDASVTFQRNPDGSIKSRRSRRTKWLTRRSMFFRQRPARCWCRQRNGYDRGW
jgi:hypothetical protein